MFNILDYTVPLDFPTSICKKVLWPCYEHSVMITGLPNISDNIFEDLVLKLMYYCNEFVASKISEDTGLEEDFIKFIQDRLCQKGYLSKDDDAITEEGKALLEKQQKPSPQFFCVYTDAISGKLIPTIELTEERHYMNYSDGDYRNNPETNTNNFSYKTSSEGDIAEESISHEEIRVLFKNFNSKDISLPAIDDILRLLRKTKIINSNKTDVQISVGSNNGKLVYRVIEVVLQEGNSSRFYATDGKGNISPFYSHVLEQHLNNLDETYIRNLRNELDIKNLKGQENRELAILEIRNPDIFKLQQILDKIRTYRSIIYNEDSENDTTDIENRKNEARRNLVHEMYKYIEYSITYICKHNPLDINQSLKVIDDFNLNSNRSVMEFVIKIAKKLGFQIDSDMNGLFCKDKYNIEMTLRGNPEMFTICSAAIIMTTVDKNYWFGEIGQKYPDFFKKIKYLKPYRDGILHTNSTKDNLYDKEISKVWDYITLILDRYLPIKARKFKKVETSETVEFMQNTDNKIYRKMEKDLGFALKSSLPLNIFLIIHDLEKWCLDGNNINNAIFITLYQLLEQCFELLKEKCPSKTMGEYEAKYLSVWKKGNGKFFSKIKRNKIEKEVMGKSTTLKSCFVAWISLEERNILEDVASQFPKILEYVDVITKLRGHGEIPLDDNILKYSKQIGDFENVNDFLLNCKEEGLKLLKYLGNNGYFL